MKDFIEKADGNTYYRLTGTVSSFSKGTNNSGKNWMQFNLTDNTGSILVYGFKDGEYDKWVNTIKDGGTVTLTGTYEFYSQKQQHEVMNTTIEKFTEGQGGQGGGGGESGDDTYLTDLSQIIALADNAAALFEGTVMAATSNSIVVSDGTSNVYVFKPATMGAVGDKVKVKGTKTTYGGVPEIAQGATLTVVSSGNAVNYPSAKVITGSFDSYTSSVTEFIEFTGTLAKSGNYYNVTVAGASTNVGSISYPVASLGLDAMAGKEVAFKGYYVGLSGGKYINLACTSAVATDGTTPGGGNQPGGGDQPGGGTTDGNSVSFSTSQLAAAPCKGAEVKMNDIISFTNSSDYGTTSVTELRIYKSQTFTVKAASGYKIKTIEFTCTASGTTKQGPGCFGTGAPSGYTFADKAGSWSGTESSVAFKAVDNQVRIDYLKVTYEAN